MNTMKNNTINLVCELPQWGDDSVNAKNLRRSSGGLIPAGIPAVECDIPGGRMIGVVGDYTLFLDGRRVLAVGRGVAEVVGTLPGEYRCHAVAGDKVVFMTASGGMEGFSHCIRGLVCRGFRGRVSQNKNRGVRNPRIFGGHAVP